MFIFRLCALLAMLMLFNSSSLYAYPNKPLRLIVPIAPGGSNDILARALSEKLSTNLRQTVIVDNRPGGGGIIGTEIAAKATGDGYTLLMVNISHALNPSMHAKLPYDPARAFAAITLIGSAPNAIVVHPSNSISSVRDLIASAKSTPGKITYASAGNASSPHLAAELFKLMSETNLLHVPYKGSGPGLAALMGAEVSVSFPVLSSALPNIPTVQESGLPEYEFSAWFGCVVPASTPKEIIDRLNKEIRVILDDAAFKARYAAQGLEIVGTTPQQFKRHLDDETSKWRKVISVSGIGLN